MGCLVTPMQFLRPTGVFDSPEPVVSQVPDGTLTVEFIDCASGTITYNIPSINRMGVIPTQRITRDSDPTTPFSLPK